MFLLLLSTPIAAVVFVDLLMPDLPAVMSKADARGATAIVLQGSGMEVHRSRGRSYGAPNREGSLRAIEAARVHRVLGGVPKTSLRKSSRRTRAITRCSCRRS